ncbi:unnamed protein product, partial [Polarella glacialis]
VPMQEFLLEYGHADAFDENDSGIRLPQSALSELLRAASELKSWPSCTVLLEGHTPGRPLENNALLRSVAEEAADICREALEKAGVENRIVCSGLGCQQGIGMRVRLSRLPCDEKRPGDAQQPVETPTRKVSPAAAKYRTAETMGGLLVASEKPDEQAEDLAEENEDGPVEGVPEVLPSSENERLALLDKLLYQALEATPLSFQPNSADLDPAKSR